MKKLVRIAMPQAGCLLAAVRDMPDAANADTYYNFVIPWLPAPRRRFAEPFQELS